MASFVGSFAASHGPLLIREWQAVPAAQKSRLEQAFAELGRRLRAANPDVLVVVSPDHWSNFFLDNYPAICIGVGAAHEGPPEPWMKAFAHRDIPGEPDLAMHIARTALAQGFEPSLSHRMKLDHGACIPLWRMGLERLPRIVPLLVNSIEPPMPSLERCYQWGTLLRRAIESYAEPLRVAVVGTGGLSHSIGEPTLGAIYEDFDPETIRRFGAAKGGRVRSLDSELRSRGTGLVLVGADEADRLPVEVLVDRAHGRLADGMRKAARADDG